MKNLKLSSLLVLFALFMTMALVLAACGGSDSESNSNESGSESVSAPEEEAVVEVEIVGDAANGEALFTQSSVGAANAPGCATCHSLETDVVLVGPSMAGVATRAETAVSGLTAEEYIRQSISEPNAFVADGFVEGIMYQNFGTDLSAEELDDVTAFLLTQK